MSSDTRLFTKTYIFKKDYNLTLKAKAKGSSVLWGQSTLIRYICQLYFMILKQPKL